LLGIRPWAALLVERRGERVVVLGGGGFVGGAIMRALTEAGFAAFAAHRHPVGGPAAAGVCDATDPVVVRNTLLGAGCVVNAVLGDAASMLAATRNITAAASMLGLRRVVHLSSMAVYGPTVGLVQESAKLIGGRSYADAKIACEAASGADAIILRPGIVYGPGGEQWAGRIGRLLRAGRLGDLGEAGDGRCNLIHARDVGAAVVAALARPGLEGRIFNLSTPAPPRWNQVFFAFGRAIGAVPVARVAAWRLMVEGRVLTPLLHLAKIGGMSARLPAAMPRSLLALFGQDIMLDYHMADQALGFARTADADGLGECAAWFLRRYGKPRR